jgi:hypothetical protein
VKPTKARIELMQAIADGAVTSHTPLMRGPRYDQRDLGPGASPRRYSRVTAAVRALHREDLVNLPPSRIGMYMPVTWGLTPAGEMWLKANGGTP